ncbi:hypothetical protein CTAYLR_003048 [Chrysophaeum taylorii]|uniref:EF-hand domain-containing protein n=1 Tax=Chrysophaeum taylorii TaxID=2483200 RepID=A0AAD7U5T3_9STRA|nr:hypothetical protein CTAYLR_003048 [Chrysophaeum taylorii]
MATGRRPISDNTLCLTDAELAMVVNDLEHARNLEIGSKAEIAILAALTKRYDAIDTNGCLAIFDMIDTDRNGYLTLDEVERGVKARVVRDYVEKTRNVTLKGLLKTDRQKFEGVFRKIDASDSGVITKSDWTRFVKTMAVERVRYMRVMGLLHGRCYWGRGLTEKSCCVPGYCADWNFYVRNNHPYLALFMRDEAHPFSRRDAFCAEVIKQSYCLCASILINNLEENWLTVRGALHNWRLSVVYITIPLMILGELLFYLLACPCLQFERRGRKREATFGFCEAACGCLGRIVVWPLALIALALIAVAMAKFYQNPSAHSDFAVLWVAGLLSEYLLTWPLLRLCVQFNLCYPDCDHFACCCYGCCGLWHFAGCGRWATERRRATRLAINDADDDAYFSYFRV